MAEWLKSGTDHVTLSVRLTPRASVARVEGLARDAAGDEHLVVRVRALPEDGAANVALIETVAKWLGLPKRDVDLVSGHTARKKIVRITGDPAALAAQIRGLVDNG